MKAEVVLCECFARDGLQHEPVQVPVDQKVHLIEEFARIGFPRVEATSYSNPKRVPQFSDASLVLKDIHRIDDVFYKATCANARAVERALNDQRAGLGANEVSFLVSASDAHSRQNLNRSREEQWKNIEEMALMAGDLFRKIGTISVAFGCPFAGAIPPGEILRDVERMLALGIRHVTLADTTGLATPRSTAALFRSAMQEFPQATLIAHFHDSRGTGLVNYLAALEAGVTHFDCALGGIGGHPAQIAYGGGYTGNVASEDWINLLESLGVNTGINLDGLMAVSQLCELTLGRQLQSRVARTGLSPMIVTRPLRPEGT